MKKFLLTIILIAMSFFAQSALPEKDLSKLTINSVPPSSSISPPYIDAHSYISKGITNMVFGAIFTGCGAVCLSYQPSPYVNYDTQTRFWCGVTFCALGGIDFIVGTAYLITGSVMLNKEKNISLSPSKNNIGIAINF